MPTYNPNDFYPRTGQEIKSDGTTVNEADGINSDGSENVVSIGKWQDLHLILEGLNMAPGALVYSSLITNVSWVRNLLVLSQSDQQYDIGIQRVDSDGTADFVTWLNTNLVSNAGQWRPIPYTGANAILGTSFKLVLRNSSASTNTYARLRVQLMGL